MTGLIAILIVGMAVFWLVFLCWFYIRVVKPGRTSVGDENYELQDMPDHDIGHEGQADRRPRKARKIASCRPERVSPPVKVEKFIDNSRLETYDDGSQAYYDGFGNLVYFRADPERNK